MRSASASRLLAVRVSVLAPVLILQAHDVILPQVGPGLHFDHMHRYLAGVLDAVGHPDRDEGGLVLFQQEYFLATRDARRAGYDHPVFGPMVMHLQRLARARTDAQAVHHEPRTTFDA